MHKYMLYQIWQQYLLQDLLIDLIIKAEIAINYLICLNVK